MDLELTDEQRMLGDTVDALLAKEYDPVTRLALLDSDAGWSRALWRRYAQLGLLGLPFEEELGGAGMGAPELTVVMQSFGRSLVLEPYLATVVLGGSLVAAAGTPQQRAALLPGVADGSTLLAFGYAERGSRWSFTDIGCTAARVGGDWRVSGQKISVLGGDSADHLVVTARTDDAMIGLFLVDGSTEGVHRDRYRMQDGQRGADLLFTDAPAQALGGPAGALADLDRVVDTASAALCAEAVGAMERMLELTVGYLKTREQFGRPISTFQALQHRAADMYVSLELARSMAIVARLALTDDDPAARRRMVHAAKIQIDTAARHIGQEAVQLHGGIGMTSEYPVGHYLKRVSVIAKTFADTDLLVDELGAAGGLIPGR